MVHSKTSNLNLTQKRSSVYMSRPQNVLPSKYIALKGTETVLAEVGRDKHQLFDSYINNESE